jgi:hypothetical protein
MARAGLLGQRSLDSQAGAAQLGDPVGLIAGGQDRQPVGRGGARVRQAAVPDGGVGEAREHRCGVLRVQLRRGLVEDAPEVGLRGRQVALAEP